MMTKKRLAVMLLAFVLGISAVIAAAQVPVIAKAESTVTYTNVLEDLQRDSSFSKENYPERATDYSLQIIQLAESSSKELFVYVYQPSGQLKGLVASSINISTTVNDAISYHNYKLELLNADGVFFKYKVLELVVKDDAVRYYAITSVYRKWDKTIDPATGNDNTVTEVNYNVSKQYAFGTINGKPYVNCVDIDTIVVRDKFVGFVRYENGFTLYNSACDSHFVAFNTDKPIDKLLEADVYYTTQSYNWNWTAFVGEKETFGTKQDNYSYLKYTDKVEHTGEGWFAGTYKWNRIQTVDDFISGENRENIFHGAVLDVKVSTKLTDSALNELKGKKWVLRFTETAYSFTPDYTGTGSQYSSSTVIGDVTILRLKFETDGITYNLGTIDNKQSGGKDPSNITDIDVSLNDTGKKLAALIMLILAIVLLAPVLPYILKAVIWIVMLPINGIAALIKAIKRKRQ